MDSFDDFNIFFDTESDTTSGSTSDECDTTSGSTSDDSDTTSIDTESTCDTISLYPLDCMNDDDIYELITTIMELCDEFMQANTLLISSPKFYIWLTKYITEILYADIASAAYAEDYYDDDDDDDEKEYQEITEFVSDIVDQFLDSYSIPRRSTVSGPPINTLYEPSDIARQIEALQNVVQPAQKSKEWYEFRNNLISASNLWKVFGSDAQRNSLIYEKCKPLDLDRTYSGNVSTSSPLHWGVKYEPLTVMIYERKWNTTIGEFGCIQHAKYPFIGASPDGISVDPDSPLFGRMLEIKNIVNRDITGIPKEEYWIQTQIQMETCDLDECDFVETRFKEYADEQEFYDDLTKEYKGVILHFMNRDLDQQVSSSPVYRYMPLDLPLTRESIDTWTTSEKESMKDTNMVLFTKIYWYMDELSCVLIQRNHKWFDCACPKIQELWETIEKERVEGYEHRASKKRSRGPSVDLTGKDAAATIKSPPAFCLIKLDEDGNVHR